MDPKKTETPEVDYKGIFDSGSALYLILLPDAPTFTIIGASGIYLASTNRKLEDIVGKGVFEAFPPNPSDMKGLMEKTFRAAFARVMETKTVDVMPVQQYDIPRAESEGGGFDTRYWSVTHNPILDAKGRLIQLAQRVEDVTELLRLKRRGEVLTKRFDQMETEVMLRAREIKDANNQLAETNRALEAFSYTVSHDLHGPLRSMISFGEILLSDHKAALNAEGQEHLQGIMDAGRRMGLLVDGILNFARLSRQEIQRERIDLTGLAQALRKQLVSAERGRKVEFVIEPAMTAAGDPLLVDVVLQNLMSNAWKFTAKKDAAKIEVGQMAAENGETVFFVRDNGAGFDMQHAPKLFESFNRLHPDAEFAGTGIGLATAKKIIQLHEGRIWANSKPDEGTTFFFTLPIGCPERAAV